MSNTVCPERQSLSDYVAGCLAPGNADEVTAHLERCTECASFVEKLEQVEAARWRVASTATESTHAHAGNEAAYTAVVEALQTAAQRMARQGERDGCRRIAEHPFQGAVLPCAGDLELFESVGGGGGGQVYRAFDRHGQRWVAVKIGAPDEEAHKRFQREAEALAALSHPNVVRLVHTGKWDQRPLLVTEWIEGFNLRELVQLVGTLAVGDACEIVRQAALAVGSLHDQGLIHRDLKPSNLMLGAGSGCENQEAADVQPHGPATNVKLLDLGIVRDEGHARSQLTMSGQILGTFDYIAPEQARDSQNVDPCTDVYGLGATLYFLLSGRSPFAGLEYDTPVKKLRGVLYHEPPSLRKLRPHLPEALTQFVHRMLAKNPEQRIATTAEVTDGLAKWSQSHRLPDLIRHATRRRTRIERNHHHSDIGRRRLLYGTAAASALTILAAIVFGVTNRNELITHYAAIAFDHHQAATTPNRIYVAAMGSDQSNGQSWNSAFADLQQALATIPERQDVATEIWVAAGRYTPSSTGDRTASFRLRNNVRLLGGFSGSEESLDDRDPSRHLTVLSGDLAGNDGPDFANSDENSHHVVVSLENDATAVLDGFVVMAGNADAEADIADMLERIGPTNADGGGIQIDGGQPTIRNCAIVRNQALHRGGGINAWRSAAKIHDCLLAHNLAYRFGGGMINHGAFEQNLAGKVTLNRCAFLRNQSLRGGGLLNWWGMSCELSGCSFLNNTATGDNEYLGGGGVYNDATEAMFADCWIIENRSAGMGGGVVAKWEPQATFVNCAILKNEARRGGGLFAINGGHPVIEFSVVWGNEPEQMAIANVADANVLATRSNIEGGWPGDANLQQLPATAWQTEVGYEWAAADNDHDAGARTISPYSLLDRWKNSLDFIDQ